MEERNIEIEINLKIEKIHKTSDWVFESLIKLIGSQQKRLRENKKTNCQNKNEVMIITANSTDCKR